MDIKMSIDEAIEHITDEMMALNDELAQFIEEHLTAKCKNKKIAEKLLDENKSMKEIHRQIWNEAKRRKNNNCAYIPDEEVKRMVDEYYDLDTVSTSADNGAAFIDIMDLM